MKGKNVVKATPEQKEDIARLQQKFRQQVLSRQQLDPEEVAQLERLIEETGYAEELGEDID